MHCRYYNRSISKYLLHLGHTSLTHIKTLTASSSANLSFVDGQMLLDST